MGRNVAEQPGSNIDIRTLAHEVAAVLSQNPLVPKNSQGQQQAGLSVQNHDQEDINTSQAGDHPPNYQAATGPSTGPSIGFSRKS